MTSYIYPKYKEALMDGNATAKHLLNGADTIRCALVWENGGGSTSYGYSASHTVLGDLYASSSIQLAVGNGGSPTYTPIYPALAGTITITNGALKASSPVTFTAVSAPAQVNRVALYVDNTSTKRLICLIDLPSNVTTNGGDITVNWDTSPDYIFQL